MKLWEIKKRRKIRERMRQQWEKFTKRGARRYAEKYK